MLLHTPDGYKPRAGPRRARRQDPDAARAAARVADFGPRSPRCATGSPSASTPTSRSISVTRTRRATRDQREHQRPAAPVLPQRHRPLRPHRRAPRRRRRRTQRQTPPDPRIHHPSRSHAAATVRPRKASRCDDRLKPPAASRHGCPQLPWMRLDAHADRSGPIASQSDYPFEQEGRRLPYPSQRVSSPQMHEV